MFCLDFADFIGKMNRSGWSLLDAFEGRGAAVKKRADVHRMAESNRAFSHFAW